MELELVAWTRHLFQKLTGLLVLLLMGTFISLTSDPSSAAAIKSETYNIASFGAKCGGVQVTDGVSTRGSHVITSASSRWTKVRPGWIAVANHAAIAGKQLVSTVKAVNSTGAIVLDDVASISRSGETISLYPDDTDAFVRAALAARSNGASLALPPNSTCGLNGATTKDFIIARTLYLNGGTLWLGQVGPDSKTGTRINFNVPEDRNASLIGPGIVDGLYQTDQGVAQDALFGVGFTAGTQSLTVKNVIIQNTKGRCLLADSGMDAAIKDLSIRNCGDFDYVPLSGDPQTGRSMGLQMQSFAGKVEIDNFRCVSAAQSCLLISGFSSSPKTLKVTINNSHAAGSGYYNYDFEELYGIVELLNSESSNIGYVSRNTSIAYNGFIARDVQYMHVTNFTSRGTDGNAFVGLLDQDPKSNSQELLLKNVSVQGSASRHKGQIYLSFGWLDARRPLTISLDNVRYDTAYFNAVSSPPCSEVRPKQQLLELRNVRASRVAAQIPSDTNFNPQGNPNSMLYVLAEDIDLGSVNIASSGPNNRAQYFDLRGTSKNGPWTFLGSATQSIAPTAIVSSAKTLTGRKFACP